LEPLKHLLTLAGTARASRHLLPEKSDELFLLESSSALAERIFKNVTIPEFLGLLLQALFMDKPAAILLLNWKNFLRHTTTHFLAGIVEWNVQEDQLSLLQAQIIPGNKPDPQARAALHLLLLAGSSLNFSQNGLLTNVLCSQVAQISRKN
jgi:hypothetical protein